MRATAIHPSPLPLRTLTQDLQGVLDHAAGQPITMGQLLIQLRERGHALFLILINIPFLLPIPFFGLSVPVGLAVASIGFCIVVGAKPWLPGPLSRRQIPFATLQKIVQQSMRITSRMEKVLKPRMKFMLWPGMIKLVGVGLILAGGFQALPLPIPGTNVFPAVIIMLLAFGLMERDGVFVIAGHAIIVVSLLLGVIFWEMAWRGCLSATHAVLAMLN